MSKERHKVIASVYLLPIHKKGEIVLLKRQNTGYEDGNFGLIAGHAEANESIFGAMAREALEESGIKLKTKDLKLCHIMHRRQEDERIDFFFTCKKWSGKIINTEPEKCSELLLVHPKKLPKNTIPYIRQAIKHGLLKKSFYSEWGY
jgi:8-oxo-dGTP diphosphatase